MVSGFFALLDDIASLMDSVASMTKIATKKTAAILGDDLAVNAEKASGFLSSREMPVLWAITKGSFLNKLIILPFAFLLSAFLPWIIIPILLLGGVYLAYEGVEKIYEYLVPHKHKENILEVVELTEKEIKALEKKKIKSAIVVDFVLSIEIVIMALSTVVGKELLVQIPVVTIISILATIGVYGIVALIVRMDDIGYKLINKKGAIFKKAGWLLVKSLPLVIKALSILGTVALILVSGGIFIHKIHFLHDLFNNIPSIIGEVILGMLVGIIALIIVKLYSKIRKLIY